MALTRLLAARGDQIAGLIRSPDHADDVRGAGASAILCDLEHAPDDDVTSAVRGSDAVVFAAGAGPGSGADRKLTMDRDGAIKLLAAASSAGVQRYVIISSIGAESAPTNPHDVFGVYLRAKADADAAVKASDRDWTIVRPGRLTDEPASGRVKVDSQPFRGRVSREDVASVLVAVLDDRRAVGRVLYVNGDGIPIAEALEMVLARDA
jgi:nucleoside-diphosphate-sugar epimerase